MLFANPLFLFALAAVSIPVIIHLFNFRKFRKEYFTNVRFLKQIKQDTQKQSQLRHWIILALRILAITMLVLAFAQPYLPSKTGTEAPKAGNTVSVFIDNSFSMEAVNSRGILFETAKQKASEIAQAYGSTDRFQLLTNDFEGKHQRLLTRDEFLSELAQIKISPATKNITEIYKRQTDLIAGETSTKRNTYIISDYQKSNYDLTDIKPVAGVNTYLISLKPNNQGNAYFDSCWFDLPVQQSGQTSSLNIRVVNKSGTDLEKFPVKLTINGQQKGLSTLNIQANSEAACRISFTNTGQGIQHGVIELTDYPVTFDDKFYFSYMLNKSVQVLCINGNGENKYLQGLFANDSSVNLINNSDKQIDFSKFSGCNLIILNELNTLTSGLSDELRRYVQNGGAMLVIPAQRTDVNNYNTFLSAMQCPQYHALDSVSAKVISLNLADPVFTNVFENSGKNSETLPTNTELPAVSKYYALLNTSSLISRPLMSMTNQKALLSVTSSGAGKVYQLAVPLQPAFSNFPQQAIFVPVIYNIALMSRKEPDIYYTIGTEKQISITSASAVATETVKIKSKDSDFEFIPLMIKDGTTRKIMINGQVKQAGNYEILNENKAFTGISFNYSGKESDPEVFDKEKLDEAISAHSLKSFSTIHDSPKPLDNIIEEMSNGIRLWKYFIWAALLFLLAEVILLRIWKE